MGGISRNRSVSFRPNLRHNANVRFPLSRPETCRSRNTPNPSSRQVDARADSGRLAIEFAFGKSTEHPVKIRGQIKPAARKLFLDQCLVCENIVGADGWVSGIQSVAHADISRDP